MGKRSYFPRRTQDTYDTPPEAVQPLLPFLRHKDGRRRFVEPCAGAWHLITALEKAGHECIFASDIEPRALLVKQLNVLDLKHSDFGEADLFITNPPWQRDILHKIILHLRSLNTPAWLLIDANWMFTAQAAPFLAYCRWVVTIGRVRSIPGTTMSGKDDAAWFLFLPEMVRSTTFIGKQKGD